MSAIVGSPEFVIYKAGSNHKLFRSNLTDETAGVIDIQSDFDTLWSNFKTTVGANPATVLLRNGVYDYDTTLTPTASGFQVFGESKYDTVLRPQGNISAFSTNSLERITIKNVKMLTELGATYTKKLLEVLVNGISRPYFNFEDLVLDHIQTSVRQQFGSAIGFQLTGANPAISWVTCRDILSNGFLNTILCDSNSGSPTGNVWINDLTFERVSGIHSFNFVKTDQLSTHDSFKWDFHKCGWQTTFIDGTTGNMFDLDDNSGARHFVWTIDKCIMWDPVNTNKKFLKVNNNCRINIENCDPIDNRYMGGAGWDSTNERWNSGALVHRSSYHNRKQGISTQSGTGIATDFNINPGKLHQNADKCMIFIAPMHQDIRELPWSIPNSLVAANQFTVRFARPPRKGTNNVVIFWEVREF